MSVGFRSQGLGCRVLFNLFQKLNPQPSTLNHDQGFTLVELLLYIAITTIMLMSIGVFVQGMFEARIKYQTIAEVEQQGQLASNLIAQKARLAKAVCTPTAGNSGATLSVDTGAGCGANQPTIFDLSGGVLRITEGATAAAAVTNSKVNVSSLATKNLALLGQPGSVQIKFTINYINNGGKNEYSYTKNFETAGSLQ